MIYAIIAVAGLVVGVVSMVVVVSMANARYNRRKKARGKATDPPKRKGFEFSKIVLSLVMFSYFLVVGLGIKLSLIDYTQYSTLAMLVGAPTATAIGFYAWKAKAENVVKIKKENPQETEGVTIDPSTIM